ncbi:Glutathione S-transferase T2 [Phytophthora nicotianae]|uniref:Glutathione S-transferase T2 n=1 Tax=Phytophthora nicotianae TaxID=4792 RepID=A0A0W8D4Y1_PHYNI|nr:Glutathione S-transferase T2 [Phytophthora nicotianae]
MAARTIGEAEVLAWSSSIRRVFMPPTELKPSPSDTDQISTLLQHVQHQTEKIEVLILQNKRLEERLLAVENHMQVPVSTSSQDPPSVRASSSAAEGQSTTKVARAKKKGSQSLAAIWFEWFTAEPRVYASPVVKKTTLYEFRHITGYMMLFLPTGFALDVASPAYKDEVLALGDKARKSALEFLKANGSSAIAAGTALKGFRKLHKQGKLDTHIAQFHELVDSGSIVDPTPPSALPTFIRLRPSQ